MKLMVSICLTIERDNTLSAISSHNFPSYPFVQVFSLLIISRSRAWYISQDDPDEKLVFVVHNNMFVLG